MTARGIRHGGNHAIKMHYLASPGAYCTQLIPIELISMEIGIHTLIMLGRDKVSERGREKERERNKGSDDIMG